MEEDKKDKRQPQDDVEGWEEGGEGEEEKKKVEAG